MTIPSLIAIVLLSALAAAASAEQQTSQVTFRVVGQMGQYQQPAGLVEGSPGVFYAVGGGGPVYAFSITPRGATTQLAQFPLGYTLGLVQSASNERLYGTVFGSGGGVINVFSVSSQPNSLISYANQGIFGVLTQNLPDGSLLGTGGQQSTDIFYLFKSDLQGDITPIYQFPSGEQLPNNAIYATDGNYYGASWQRFLSGGGESSGGYIYRVTPSGSLTKLYTLPPGTFNSATSFVPILQATDGNLYGVTTGAGANDWGSVYRLTLSGEFTTLYSFAQGPGATPQSLIQASDGNLYIASLGSQYTGQLSRMSTFGQFAVLHNMNSTANGGYANA